MKSIWLDHTITLLNHFGPSASFLFYDEEWEPLGSTWPIEIDGTIVTGYFLDTTSFWSSEFTCSLSQICRWAQVCDVI